MAFTPGVALDPTINDIHGQPLHRLNLRDSEIDIEDLAVALSNTCRFGQRCPKYYSVAQHSLICSEMAPGHLALKALLHDAAEAYSFDIPKPEKSHPAYAGLVQVQDDIQEMVYRHFGIDPSPCPELHEIDLRMRATERRELFGRRATVTKDADARPYDIRIIPMLPDEARGQFLCRFRQLTNTLGRQRPRQPMHEQYADQGAGS